MPKRILLTLPDLIYKKLSQKIQKQGFSSIQELINEILRKNILGSYEPKIKDTKLGRPKKLEFEDYFSTPTRESKKIEQSGGH